MLVTIINKTDTSKVVILNSVDSVSSNGTSTTFTQDSITYSFTDANYRYVTVNPGS